MSQALKGMKVAVLVGNGFNESDLIGSQKLLASMGVNVRIVGITTGLVTSWNGAGWGLHFAPDSALSESLSADYDAILIPGGHRSIEKLKLTAHTARFLRGFVEMGKAVVVCDSAVSLLLDMPIMKGRTVAGPEAMRSDIAGCGMEYSDQSYAIDGNLLTKSEDMPAEAMPSLVLSHLEAFAVQDDKVAA